MNELLKADNLRRYYPQKQQKIGGKYPPVKALDGVSFTLQKGRVLGILGESGCGKSTLGRLLVLLEKPTSGALTLLQKDAQTMLKEEPLQFRRLSQIVFQNPYDAFNPRFTIQKSMMRPLSLHHIGKDEAERQTICVRALESAGMSPAKDYLSRFPHELSGGQLQRISILRSMLLSPAFLVADEPVSMLDVSVRAEVMNLLTKLIKTGDMGMVFISHDIGTTRAIADDLMVMYLGRAAETGKTDDVLHSPMHPYTQALISNCGGLSAAEDFSPIRVSGEPPVPIGDIPGCPFAGRCFRACPKCFTVSPKGREVAPGHFVYCHQPMLYTDYLKTE